MHDGLLATFDDVLDHYNGIAVDPVNNRNLDNRLSGGGRNSPGQKLVLTVSECSVITEFMKTLARSNIYTDPKWSDPFDENGNLQLR